MEKIIVITIDADNSAKIDIRGFNTYETLGLLEFFKQAMLLQISKVKQEDKLPVTEKPIIN